MNMVRFAIGQIRREPYVGDWLDVFHTLQGKIEARGLPLIEAKHRWHDRWEYAIYTGATDEMLPSLLEIAREMGCSVQCPFVEDKNWYHPETAQFEG